MLTHLAGYNFFLFFNFGVTGVVFNVVVCLYLGREQKERFSPVRRGSEGSASGARTLSPSTPQQECQRLQRGLQTRNSPPRSIPGTFVIFSGTTQYFRTFL